MREAFEEALGRVGVHPLLGCAVWGAYLVFEKDELEDAEETGAGDAEVSKARERQEASFFFFLLVDMVIGGGDCECDGVGLLVRNKSYSCRCVGHQEHPFFSRAV